MQLHELGKKNLKIWVNDDVMPYFQKHWFDSHGKESSHTRSQAQGGRQAVQRFEVNSRHFVLRHYFRGGVPAQFTKDRFLFRGWRATRPYREMHLLFEMSQLGLPVPFPAAARCIVERISYTADIVMVEIPDCESLATVLTKRSLTKDEWRAVGSTIQRFHRRGIQHVDLNANNILIGQNGNIHLIDFDRCVRRTYQQRWAVAGLDRLQRSLKKLKQANEELYYQQSDFQNLIYAYQE